MNKRLIRNKCILLLLASFLVMTSSCKKKEDDPIPTSSAFIFGGFIGNQPSGTGIAKNDFMSFTAKVRLTSVATGGIQDYGFVWDTKEGVDINSSGKKSLGTTTDTLTASHTVTNLTPGQTYHVNFYIMDQVNGLRYGDEQKVTILETPTVTSLSITEGGVGDTVIINGTNFSSTLNENTVKFGTIEAKIATANPSSLKCIVPSSLVPNTEYNVEVSIRGTKATSSTKLTFLGGVWTQKKDFGGVNRTTETVSFTLNSKAYIGLGRTGTSVGDGLNDLWEYDPTTDTWAQKANYLGGKRTASVSFVIQNIAFVGLGTDEKGAHKKDFWQYNPSTNKWSPVADFIGTPAFSQQIGFAVGGKGYVVKQSSKELWEIDLGLWKQKNNLPFTPIAHFLINGVVYFSSTNSSFWKYDANTDSWTTTSEDFKGAFLGRESLNGKGYIASGFNDNYVILEYDLTSKTVQRKRSLLGAIPGKPKFVSLSESFVIGSKIYVRDRNTNTFWEFDPSK